MPGTALLARVHNLSDTVRYRLAPMVTTDWLNITERIAPISAPSQPPPRRLATAKPLPPSQPPPRHLLTGPASPPRRGHISCVPPSPPEMAAVTNMHHFLGSKAAVAAKAEAASGFKQKQGASSEEAEPDSPQADPASVPVRSSGQRPSSSDQRPSAPVRSSDQRPSKLRRVGAPVRSSDQQPSLIRQLLNIRWAKSATP